MTRKATKQHFVGSCRPLTLAHDLKSVAEYGGPSDCFRYKLHRVWDESQPDIFWVMMNPSVATEYGDDRTVAKCQRYARAWGFGGIYVGNTFAYRCTDQRRLREVADPVGPRNDAALLEMAHASALTILAYGSPVYRDLQSRGPAVSRLLSDAGIPLYVLRMTARQRPEHPLYLPASLSPQLVSSETLCPIITP